MGMVILGLGGNLGARERHLQQAVDHIRKLLGKVECSPVYESPAMLPKDAPPEWNIPFLNMAVCGETSLAPLELLQALKDIERSVGRLPRAHWGPREIDIDILALGYTVIAEPELSIPHLGLLKRDFALVPLADLAPHWKHPEIPGKEAAELALPIREGLKKTDIVIL